MSPCATWGAILLEDGGGHRREAEGRTRSGGVQPDLWLWGGLRWRLRPPGGMTVPFFPLSLGAAPPSGIELVYLTPNPSPLRRGGGGGEGRFSLPAEVAGLSFLMGRYIRALPGVASLTGPAGGGWGFEPLIPMMTRPA